MFLSTGIDCLAMHEMLIAKAPYYRILYPILKWGSDVATMIKVGTDVGSLGPEINVTYNAISEFVSS